MSAGQSRRNGKAASCEPCRRGKIRCDHQRPTCGRCQRRNLTAQCFYHPAPLTKPRGSGSAAAGSHAFNVQPAPRSEPVADQSRAPGALPEIRDRTRPPDGHNTGQTYGFPWPSSWTASPGTHGQQSLYWSVPRARDDAAEDQRLPLIKEVLTLLKHFRFMQILIEEYAIHAQASLVPQPISMSFMDSLADLITTYASADDANGNDDGFSQMVRSVFKATSAPIETPDDLAGFLAMYSGENMRLETIGLLYTMSATACHLGLARDDDKHTEFIEAMYRGSTSCLRLVRDISPEINDVMLWLSFENMRLTTHTEGDSSPIVWRRLGNVTTDIFAAGFHREAKNTSKTPFFLAECRRKAFVAAYQLDKFIATLLDLPPRILRRYSDCKMPLELTDEQLLSDPEALAQARARLSPDGWSPDKQYIPATWQRVRFQLGMLREDILEYPFLPPTLENNAALKNLAQRCHQTYDSLPAHLKYNPDSWNAIPPPACLMLTVMRLNYLQSCFQIQRLLQDTEPSAWSELLRVSAETVATVLQIGNSLNKAIFLRHDFPYIVVAYGLPSAVMLAYALQSTARGNKRQALPSDLSRASLIRHLAVFVSHLESISDFIERNNTICIQASKAITRALDEVLDMPATPAAAASIAPQTAGTANDHDSTGPLATPALSASQPILPDGNMNVDADLFSGDLLDGFDLSSWVKNIDWTGTGGEWSTF
ncbi:hypothetical protein DOTSEDRAFT_147401 [Dothistroma septosporum NZE10]|uniref:Zn(2)-C6 fungal-type domain-containing protein n=1 Tax=Dothistroma septosporum (strain NZE10 / CBS 128990) TaxID=675120 RepID=N1PYU8_DOTSN|nr:hypothetical protein DOTSEDRAFT_147401 [Dothistroma septosporum NZE10]